MNGAKIGLNISKQNECRRLCQFATNFFYLTGFVKYALFAPVMVSDWRPYLYRRGGQYAVQRWGRGQFRSNAQQWLTSFDCEF